MIRSKRVQASPAMGNVQMSGTKDAAPLLLGYNWELTNIKEDPLTVLSPMIKYRKEESFRAGLKNQAISPTLFFLATNLNKMGMKVIYVKFSSGDEKLEEMTNKTKMEDNKTGCVQLFTASLKAMASGNCNFHFEIYTAGTIDDYEVLQVDDRLNGQLWSSVFNRSGTDFEVVVGEKKFSVHKYILAARSPVFADQFSKESFNQDASKTMRIESVGIGSMESFLKFIYTGELDFPVKDDQLMQLAKIYRVKTLENLCEAASFNVDESEIARLALQLRTPGSGGAQSLMEVKPDSGKEITSESNTSYFKFTWNVNNWTETSSNKNSTISETFESKEKKQFRAQLDYIGSQKVYDSTRNAYVMRNHEITLTFLSYQNKKINYRVEQVAYSIDKNNFGAVKMNVNSTSDESLLQVFTDTLTTLPQLPLAITFYIKLTSTIPSFSHKLVDSTWKFQLWASAVNKQLTDVEFQVGGESFAAHRSLLSARSSVFAAMFDSGMKELHTGKVQIDDVDPDMFRCFLEFLYTGMLESSSAISEKLFAVADKYGVETLMDLCRSTTLQPVSMADMTKAFFAL